MKKLNKVEQFGLLKLLNAIGEKFDSEALYDKGRDEKAARRMYHRMMLGVQQPKRATRLEVYDNEKGN